MRATRSRPPVEGSADGDGVAWQLRTLQGRLDDVDSAYYVHSELDSRRHGALAAELSLRIGGTQTALDAMEPDIDISLLFDEQFVRARWDEHVANGRRDLLRLA